MTQIVAIASDTATSADKELWGWNFTTKRRRGAADLLCTSMYREMHVLDCVGQSDMCEAVPKIHTNDLIPVESDSTHIQLTSYIDVVSWKRLSKGVTLTHENKRKQDLSANNNYTQMWQPDGRSKQWFTNDVDLLGNGPGLPVSHPWHPYREIRGERVTY